jgi:DsbC/DsbD-like thiol-disulfide interchange protein
VLRPSFALDGIQVYEGNVELVAQFAKGALAQAAALRATIDAQACTQTVCLPPSKILVVVRVGR